MQPSCILPSKHLNTFNNKMDEQTQLNKKLIFFKKSIDECTQQTLYWFENILVQFNQLLSMKEYSLGKVEMSFEQNQIFNEVLEVKEQFSLCMKNLHNFLDQNNRSSHECKVVSSHQQGEFGYAFSFNQSNTQLVASCNQVIKVFDFKDGKLAEIQKLNGHSQDVYCLQFLKQTDQFISADSNIILWDKQKDGKWKIKQILKGHQMIVYCLVVNKVEDQLISGSQDKTLKTWQQENNSWKLKQSIDCQSRVFSISLNNSEEKLIAAVEDHAILVLEKQNNEWIITINIQVEQFGYRLSFTSDDEYVFQPFDRQYLEVYEYKVHDQIFTLKNKVKYENKGCDGNCLFPIRFVKEKGILMVKNDHYVNFIQVLQKELIVIQSIDFSNHVVYGNISEDGQNLVTWDKQSRQMQIRKIVL